MNEVVGSYSKTQHTVSTMKLLSGQGSEHQRRECTPYGIQGKERHGRYEHVLLCVLSTKYTRRIEI
jgi:hypothetical protein